MSKRKIKIKCSSINGIKLSEEQVISVWIEESGDSYKKLSTSPDILEWDFDFERDTEENVADEVIEAIKPKENPTPTHTRQPELTNEEEIVKVCREELGVDNYQKMAVLLEAMLIVGYRSPNLLFTPPLFQRGVKKQYEISGNQPQSIENAVAKMILESYYSGITIDEALLDTVIKVKPLWKNLKDYPTLASFAYKLYNKNGEKEKER